MRGEGEGVEGGVEDAADAAVFLGGRLGVELPDDAVLGVGFRDDHLDRSRFIIVAAEGPERKVGRHQDQHRRIGEGHAPVDDEGALEPQSLAGRAADDGDVVEGHVQRRDDRLLPPAHPVDEQDAEQALAGEARPQGDEFGAQPLGQLATRLDMEVAEVEDRTGHEGEMASQESDCDDRALAPPFGGELARGGAADHRRHAEAPRDLGGEGRDVVIGRDEDDQPGEVVGRELARDLGSSKASRSRSTRRRRPRRIRPSPPEPSAIPPRAPALDWRPAAAFPLSQAPGPAMRPGPRRSRDSGVGCDRSPPAPLPHWLTR